MLRVAPVKKRVKIGLVSGEVLPLQCIFCRELMKTAGADVLISLSQLIGIPGIE
jgi:hypothetical protein